MGEQPTLKKGSFIVWSGENELLHIPLRDVDAFVRQSCKRCVDFTAEYADISVGGIGCSNGYSTVVARTEKGLQLFKDAQQARYLETQELTPRKATSKSLTWLKRNGCEKT
jgi:coenzyme F420 hydrogenase subunit beta